jgi:hypothetical protein
MNVRWLVVLAAAVASSCLCAPAPCTQNSECASGQQCTTGQCLTPCTQSSTCGSGTSCADGFCRATCQSSGSCSGDQACAAGACRPKSCGTTTCAPDTVCIADQCVSVACAGVSCPAGQACANGQCLSTSCAGVQCAAGEVCINATCTDAACVGVICPGNTICLSGVCLSPGDPLPYALVCDAMARGYKNTFTQGISACRAGPATEADVAHQPFISVSNGLSTRPTTGTLQQLFSVLTCDPTVSADGGIFTAALAGLDSSISAGHVSYDGLKARACINAGYDGGISSACREVFKPLVQPGGLCDRTEDCPNDHYCRPSGPGTCAGSCQPRLSDNAPCEPTRDLCATSTCQADDAGFRCKPSLSTPSDGGSPAGSDCTPGLTQTCASSLRCVRDTSKPTQPDGGPGGTCTAAVGLGLACGVQTSLGPACTGTCLSCYSTDGMTGLCRERGGGGALCRLDGDCLDMHLCLGNTCRPMPRPGEACLVTQNGARGNCLWADNYCRQSAPDAGSGTCVAIPELNQACGSRYDLTDVCASGYCAQGICKPEPKEGEACTGRCSGNLRCESRDGGAQACWPLRTAGEPCLSTTDCESTLRCLTNVCVGRFAAGSVCTRDDECLSNNCLDGAKTCAETCFSPLTVGKSYSTGCPGGLRDWALLLAYSSLALVVGGRRRRR